ncbi:hypothetical protein WICMUC_005977 [Wickerhamomyces mucosus]|uniref:Protein transport protein USE1 n=1 Tax=Wickerhamomyces mucosus TaxID=1378264 RepID=A0A9P8T2A9_9ASCO|nr:hypothetical protein WICMUC_005977 [Wickerhamomyces mucosus]
MDLSINLIEHYNNKLQKDIIANEENDPKIAFLNHLNYSKHETISNKLRKQIIISGIEDKNLKDLFAHYNNLIINGKFINDLILANEKKELEKKRQRRLSIDFHKVDINDNNNDNDDDDNNNNGFNRDKNGGDVSNLRRRLLKSNRTVAEKTFDEELIEEESHQEDILKDMFQFIQGIKEGANEFNKKLSEDSNLLKAAESGLNVTSIQLGKSSENLAKTIKELSLWNALKFAAMIIISFLVCIILILVFPKW